MVFDVRGYNVAYVTAKRGYCSLSLGGEGDRRKDCKYTGLETD
jgi:hypothetical protein